MRTNERETLEMLGDHLCGVLYKGWVVIEEPWRMPLPRQESFVNWIIESDEAGLPTDLVSMSDWCEARGIEAWRLQYTYASFPNIQDLARFYPSEAKLERLKQRVMEGSAQVRVALLFESGAEEVRRGRFPTRQLAMLRNGGQDGA